MRTEEVHISQIAVGDTVIHGGHQKTVGNHTQKVGSPNGTKHIKHCDIQHGGFCGSTLFGDSYRMGARPVVRVIFKAS